MQSKIIKKIFIGVLLILVVGNSENLYLNNKNDSSNKKINVEKMTFIDESGLIYQLTTQSSGIFIYKKPSGLSTGKWFMEKDKIFFYIDQYPDIRGYISGDFIYWEYENLIKLRLKKITYKPDLCFEGILD